MDSITHKIAEYSSTSKFDDLTEESVHAATQRLIDSLGCALGAYDCEPAQIGRRLAAGQVPDKYPGYVLCFGDRLPAEAATFINSAMIRNFDFNDRYPGGHPSDCLGALLALAGAMNVDGKPFLTSMIVVYEIFARLSDATTLSRRGWDQGYAIGIATAAGVCNLLKLSMETGGTRRRHCRRLQSTATRHAIRGAHALEKCRHSLRGAKWIVRCLARS